MRRKFNIPPTAEIVYTDGSCLHNGTIMARAGYGVYFSENNPRNLSARLPGQKQSNQRAELYAVLRALETYRFHQRDGDLPKTVYVLTDSKYVVQALTDWVKLWEINGWVTGDGQPVISQDLFERAWRLLKILKVGKNGIEVVIKHVKGHSGIYGNHQADQLAFRGREMVKVRALKWSEEFDDEALDSLLADAIA
jgi:ribonuclease HI